MNATIQRALESQGPGDGDTTDPPSIADLHESVEEQFPGALYETYVIYLKVCHQGRGAVIDELTAGTGLAWDRADLVSSFFGEEGVSQDIPPGSLGPKLSSFVLQLDKDLLPKKLPPEGSSRPLSKTIDPVSAPYPADYPWRPLTIGDIETEESQDRVRNAFEDIRAFQLVLLLNRLLNTWAWRHLSRLAHMPFRFDAGGIDLESNATQVLSSIQRNAISLLDAVMAPALEVYIDSHNVVGGRTDISVAVRATDERDSARTQYLAVIELNRPSCGYRVANALAFGEVLEQGDEGALEEAVNPSKVQKLAHTRTQLREFSYLRLKHTVDRSEEELIHGYTCDGVDVTTTLELGYLKRPLDALHVGLEQASRYSALNDCRNMAVSDGFTMIGTHLRDLQEVNDDLIEANFNSHYAVDMTANGSVQEIFNYFTNAVCETGKSRRYLQIVFNAAREHFDGGVITPEKSDGFNKLVKDGLANYKFHSDVYFQGNGLRESARVLTRYRVPVIQRALAQFAQEFGAIAECGECLSSSFHVLEYFRVNEMEGIPSDDNPIPGRSRSIAKVNFVGVAGAEAGRHSATAASQKLCVLKIYDAHEASIARMERELKAYHRVAQLAESDQQRVAKLLAFGAIDLEDVDPRLFILIEYIEDSPAGEPSIKEQSLEIKRVSDILKSVGVHHNDLAERNVKWQVADGEWIIKVFDFDHATFDDCQLD